MKTEQEKKGQGYYSKWYVCPECGSQIPLMPGGEKEYCSKCQKWVNPVVKW